MKVIRVNIAIHFTFYETDKELKPIFAFWNISEPLFGCFLATGDCDWWDLSAALHYLNDETF